MKWRRTAILLTATALLLTACDDAPKDPGGLPVEVLAGGGTNAAAVRGLDAQITGTVEDLEVGRDGIVRLLSRDQDQTSILLLRPDGSLQRIDLGAADQRAGEVAVGDDGTMYVGHEFPGGFGIAQVTLAGKITRFVGGSGLGFSKDGAAATGPDGGIDGLTVDRQGRLVYSESLPGPSGRDLKILRRVESDGRIRTIAGRTATFAGSDDYQAALTKSAAPPAGTKALQWALPGLNQTATLSTGDDDTIYAESLRAVLAFAPDGTVKAPVPRREYGAAKIGDRPFTHEGDAVDADPNFTATQYHNVSARGGYIAMLTYSDRSGRPPGFRWSSDLTPGQRELAEAEPANSLSGDSRQVVRLALPDGSVTTAAWWAEGAAIHDGWLYLVTGNKDDRLLIGRVKLPA